MADERLTRPGVLRWLWYALGGTLPGRYREWVLHDVTVRTWWVRQIARALLVQALPVAVVVGLLIPGTPLIRVLAVTGGVFVAMIYVVAFLEEAVEHRAMKAGYPRGFAKGLRESSRQPERDAAARRYDERYRG